jgi:hypothetical protein
MGAIFGWLLNFLGGNVVQDVLNYLQVNANTDVQKSQIAATKETTLAATSASVVLGGMAHKTFWFFWALFVAPLAFWWIIVFTNTVLAGWVGSWDIAEIPPQLVPWANFIFSNVFYSGAGVAGVGIISTAAVQVAKIVKKV